MKKILLVVAASSLLMGSMLVQAENTTDSSDIKQYVLELDTTDMSPEEIESTRGEVVRKYKKIWGKRVLIGAELKRYTYRDRHGKLRTRYYNH